MTLDTIADAREVRFRPADTIPRRRPQRCWSAPLPKKVDLGAVRSRPLAARAGELAGQRLAALQAHELGDRAAHRPRRRSSPCLSVNQQWQYFRRSQRRTCSSPSSRRSRGTGLGSTASAGSCANATAGRSRLPSAGRGFLARNDFFMVLPRVIEGLRPMSGGWT